MRTRDMALMTWKEVENAAANNTGIILPIGATEQHGLHLPLCTDSYFPREVALEIADETNMIVAPTICYGYRSRPLSGGGQAFPGTTSISGATLMAEVQDLLEEFIRHGFKKIALYSWHWENQNFIYESAFLVSKNHPDVKIAVIESAFDHFSKETMDILFAEDSFPGWAREHASIVETSLMLFKKPEWVLMDRAVNDQSEEYPNYDILPIPNTFYPKSGSLWHAAKGSKEKGEVAWKEIIEWVKSILLKEFPC